MPKAIENIRSQFPIFSNHPGLAYLDNAATSHKPVAVLKCLADFYEKENASVHRGLYDLSANATLRYEEVRKKVASMIGAKDPSSIAFTKGTTESINIVAQSFRHNLKEGDNIIITAMEHHANLIPWQVICQETGATLKVIPVDDAGELMLEKIDTTLDHHTRLFALTHISNVLGTVNPVEEIIIKARQYNVPVLVDAAQSAGHWPVNVSSWDADFLAFSAHKMFGPMGTGVLYAKEKWRSHIQPLIYGGGAIKNVEFESTEFLDYPFHLEAGTAHVAGVLGLGSAVDFISTLDQSESMHYIQSLASSFREKAGKLGYVSFLGNPKKSAGIVSFQVKDVHPHDVASFLASRNVSVRAGHHCAQPLLKMMGVPATVRISFAIYNTWGDVDQAIEAIIGLKKFWS